MLRWTGGGVRRKTRGGPQTGVTIQKGTMYSRAGLMHDLVVRRTDPLHSKLGGIFQTNLNIYFSKWALSGSLFLGVVPPKGPGGLALGLRAPGIRSGWQSSFCSIARIRGRELRGVSSLAFPRVPWGLYLRPPSISWGSAAPSASADSRGAELGCVSSSAVPRFPFGCPAALPDHGGCEVSLSSGCRRGGSPGATFL